MVSGHVNTTPALVIMGPWQEWYHSQFYWHPSGVGPGERRGDVVRKRHENRRRVWKALQLWYPIGYGTALMRKTPWAQNNEGEAGLARSPVAFCICNSVVHGGEASEAVANGFMHLCT